MLLAISAVVLPFLVNGAVELSKWLTRVSTTGGKRFLLAILSLVGVVSFSSLNGIPLDPGTVSGLIQMLLGVIATFIASHGSYSLITGKTASQNETVTFSPSQG